MLESLTLYNFHSGFCPIFARSNDAFVMKTCQRTIVLNYGGFEISNLDDCESYEVKKGQNAYLFLLKITCGLKSKLLGENEIVAQFKKAYQEYLLRDSLNKKVLSTLEKLLKDTKEIRTKYLIGLGQKTYASITRRKIYNDHKASKVLILGSGQMAEDLINQFKKKCDIVICARNLQAIANLKLNHEFETIDWGDYASMMDHGFICNTIGSEDVIFNGTFFKNWSMRHLQKAFIDLGAPCAIETSMDHTQNVYRLDDVLNEGAIKENSKKVKIQEALVAMNTIVERRQRIFSEKQAKLYNYA